jgi:hypothetical protein
MPELSNQPQGVRGLNENTLGNGYSSQEEHYNVERGKVRFAHREY